MEKQTSAIDKELKEISNQLNGFNERLIAADRKISDNKLSLNTTLEQAKKSMETAKETMKVIILLTILIWYLNIYKM